MSLLDSLMTLAGELVLSRNQLNESLSRQDERGIRSGAQRVSLVTSELQEVVTQTRMQPVGGLFGKFPRLVRDLARDFGKDVQLKLEGGEVEIDKTILEGLSDPLTHMVRNAVDHGIEPPAQRTAAGKPAMGTVTLKASHQAGQVVIEISDDGKGLAAEKIAASSVAKGWSRANRCRTCRSARRWRSFSCRASPPPRKSATSRGAASAWTWSRPIWTGWGARSKSIPAPGRGSRFRIKLPLTLAIIPSLLVSDGGERFAIPQVSVGELIRIPAAQLAERTDRVGDAEVLNVRDRLVPLLYLADALGVPRPENASKALNVVLVDTGAFEYGLVVEELHDTVEIVVKPLGRHLKGLHDYAGATILGDGRVAVILDVAGLAARAKLTAGSGGNRCPAMRPRRALHGRRTARPAAVPKCSRRGLRRAHRAGVAHRAGTGRADPVSGRTPHHAVLRRQPAAGVPARHRRGRRTDHRATVGGDRFREAWAVRWDCWPPSRWTWWKRRSKSTQSSYGSRASPGRPCSRIAPFCCWIFSNWPNSVHRGRRGVEG